MAKVRLTFIYLGKEYKIELEFDKMGKEKIRQFVEEGAWSCDCERSKAIYKQDKTFPILSCGHRIRLSNLDVL